MTPKKKRLTKPHAYNAKTALSEGLRYAAKRYIADFPGQPPSVILEVAVGAALFRAGQTIPGIDSDELDHIVDTTMALVGRDTAIRG
jgi:hypothetical protein